MMEAKVWAPTAQSVELVSGSHGRPMDAGPRGWRHCAAPLIRHATEYAFRVDGEGPFPDPRSPWQPAGVDGPSRRLDHDRFQWTDGAWQAPPLGSGVLYELHIGTFTPEGTFAAAITRLDHLIELGITHVELMPVAAFSGDRGWGYDGVNLYAPHFAYGDPEDLKRFIDACHARGLAVVLDVVYNHLGPHGNHLGRFGPYFTDRYTTPWGEAVNFDGPHSDEVRRFFVDNACMWLRDYHFDGLRLDAVHAMVDQSATHFIEQLGAAVRRLACQLERRLVLIAESDLNTPRIVQSTEVGGYGMDAQWMDDFHHAVHTALTSDRSGYYADYRGLEDVARSLCGGYVYEGQYAPSRQRSHGRPAQVTDARRFVVCIQNHDQVGNRALGERLHHLAGMPRAKVGAALLLTAPFVPLLFQGEEWAASSPFQYFTAHDDPALGEAVRNGRQHEFVTFGWSPDQIPDPQDPATFERSRLPWSERAQGEHATMHAWYKALIRLRRAEPDLRTGDLRGIGVECRSEQGVLRVQRGSILTACCLSEYGARLPLPRGAERASLVLQSDPHIRIEDQTLVLPPDSVGIVKVNTDHAAWPERVPE